VTPTPFNVLGAAKPGAAALCAYLSQHPEVYLSPNQERSLLSKGGMLVRAEKPAIEPAAEASPVAALTDDVTATETSPGRPRPWERFCS
jgi:hypothetical protein